MNKKKLFCAPNIESNNQTCYTHEDLLFLVKAYNKHKPKKYHISTTNKTKKELWENLNRTFRKDCDQEWCWLEQNFIPAPYANKKIKETFKPEMPKEWTKNPFEWLSTTDIEKVMKQYEKKYPEFQFIGPEPVDCPSSIQCSLTGLNVEKLAKKGKTKLGIIFNLDKHDQPGSHWVATFFDFEKCKIFYFDSVGMPPPKMIYKFLKDMKKSCEEYHITNFNKKKNVDIFVNNTQFQFGNSECGIFSMHFIISNLQGKTLKKFNKNTVNDTVMNELRKNYYRPPE